MANGGAIGVGLFFLMLAVIGLIVPVTDDGKTTLQSNNMCESGWGQFGQFFSGDLQDACLVLSYLTLGIYASALIGIILIIIGAVVPSNSGKNNRSYKDEVGSEKHNAMDILNERYAKGEISKEEYDRMKKDLNSGI